MVRELVSYQYDLGSNSIPYSMSVGFVAGSYMFSKSLTPARLFQVIPDPP